MNLGFDAKRAFLNNSGLGNYSRTLLKALIQAYPENNFTLYTTSKGQSLFSDFIASAKQVKVIQPENFIAKKLPSIWRSFEITEQLIENKCTLYHGLSNELPHNIHKFQGKKIVTIHDLIFLRYPELYPLLDREIYERKVKSACEKADFIIAISEQTKSDLINFFKISVQKIRVVYQSCDAIYYTKQSELDLKRVKEKYSLPNDYLLSVGTIEERKNLLTIIKALNLLEDVKLVVVGKKRDYYKKIMEYIELHKLNERVLFLENVDTNDLPAIYKLAAVFIYPSLFEGFGIPILEAITCKTPVIAANTSSLPEAGGKDSIYITATDYNQLADEIKKLRSSVSWRKNCVDKGFDHALKFKPQVIADEIMKIYLE